MDFPRLDPIFRKLPHKRRIQFFGGRPIFFGIVRIFQFCLEMTQRKTGPKNWIRRAASPNCGHGPENWIRFSQKLDPERGIPIFQNSKGNVTIPLDSRKIGSGGKIGSRVGNWIPSKNRIRGKNWIPSENWIRGPPESARAAGTPQRAAQPRPR